jgi:hypothetical protein
MKKSLFWGWSLAAALLLLAPAPGMAETFTFKVKHNHTVGGCEGVLIVGENDVRYQSDYRADSRIWTYLDIKKVESPSLRKLRLETREEQVIQFGREKVFEFEFIDGEVTDELYNFIVNRIARPPSTEPPRNPPGGRWEIAAKHGHTFGGCEGTLNLRRLRGHPQDHRQLHRVRHRQRQRRPHVEIHRHQALGNFLRLPALYLHLRRHYLAVRARQNLSLPAQRAPRTRRPRIHPPAHAPLGGAFT